MKDIMSDIQNVKKDIENAISSKQLIDAMECGINNSLQKVDNALLNHKKFLLDFFQIISYLPQNFIKNLFTNKQKKRLVVVMSGDCTHSEEESTIMFKSILNDYDSKCVDIYCVGKHSLSFFMGTDFNIVGYSALSNEFEQTDLVMLYNYISESIANYSDILFCVKGYNKKKHLNLSFSSFLSGDWLLSMRFLSIKNIDTFSNLSKKENVGDVQILEVSDLQKELIEQFIQHTIYGFALQVKSTELQLCISKIKREQISIDDFIKGLLQSLNRIRYSLITAELSKIMASKVLV